MIKILFVCHGNICRSPMAELVFKKMAADAGLSGEFEVESRATSAEELGNPVYPPARAELLRHGISSDGKYAIQLSRSDYSKYDLLIGMDSANIRNMHRLFGGDPDRKIRKLMEYTSCGGDVADPWYTGDFDITYKDILSGCTELMKILKEEIKK